MARETKRKNKLLSPLELKDSKYKVKYFDRNLLKSGGIGV